MIGGHYGYGDFSKPLFVIFCIRGKTSCIQTLILYHFKDWPSFNEVVSNEIIHVNVANTWVFSWNIQNTPWKDIIRFRHRVFTMFYMGLQRALLHFITWNQRENVFRYVTQCILPFDFLQLQWPLNQRWLLKLLCLQCVFLLASFSFATCFSPFHLILRLTTCID